MEIEKTLAVAAPATQVWNMLLDPSVMGGCVPGMKSIEVISDVEYIAVMHVKISFISAKFKLKTKIVEQRAPHYLRTEGTGEDTSVASSLKQQSEIFLTELPDGGTELRMKVKVDVLGRLGTFGLSVMKTKADRMWDEFSQNLAARLNGEAPAQSVQVTRVGAAAGSGAAAPAVAAGVRDAAASGAAEARVVAAASAAAHAASAVPPQGSHASYAAGSAPAGAGAAHAVPPAAGVQARVNGMDLGPAPAGEGGWLSRLLGGKAAAPGRGIHIELRKGDTSLRVEWPAEKAGECAAWLREALK